MPELLGTRPRGSIPRARSSRSTGAGSTRSGAVRASGVSSGNASTCSSMRSSMRRHPAAARLEEHEPQPREAFAHAAHEQPAHRDDHVDGIADRLAERGTAVDLVHRHVRDAGVLAHRDEPELAARAGRVDVHGGMERDRALRAAAHVGPEGVVDVMVERQTRRRTPTVGRTRPSGPRSCARSHLRDARGRRPAAVRRPRRTGACGCVAQNSASQSLYARRQSPTNSTSCSAGISSHGPKNIARTRVEHDRVDAVGVHVGDVVRRVRGRPGRRSPASRS